MRALVGNSLFVALFWDGTDTLGTSLGTRSVDLCHCFMYLLP